MLWRRPVAQSRVRAIQNNSQVFKPREGLHRRAMREWTALQGGRQTMRIVAGPGRDGAEPGEAVHRAHVAWPQVAAYAQQVTAGALAAAIAQERLDRERYQHWMAMESAACRIGAIVLDRLAGWHGVQPQLRATALSWATCLRDDALAAAADVRALDGFAAPPPDTLARWHAYAEAACHSPRAGEALGTVLLHSALLQGAARAAIDLVLELPFLATRGRGWLLRRRGEANVRTADERAELMGAWPAAALAAGAQRAAAWHREALHAVLGGFPPATPDTAFTVANGD